MGASACHGHGPTPAHHDGRLEKKKKKKGWAKKKGWVARATREEERRRRNVGRLEKKNMGRVGKNMGRIWVGSVGKNMGRVGKNMGRVLFFYFMY